MIKAVLFDIDGTLIDSVDFHAEAWQQILRRHGREVPFKTVRDQIGKGGDKLMAEFLSPEQIDREGKQIEQERRELFMREYLPRVKPFPGLQGLFERIKKDGKKIALASSAQKEELNAYKRIAGVEPFLEAETSSDDVSNSKPDPDIFVAALKSLKTVAPFEAVAVGDTTYDAQAAGEAGIATVGVLCGGVAAEKLRAAGCIAIYNGPADLLQKYAQSPLQG